MVCDGNCIKAVAPCLIYTERRPYTSVGEACVNMEVTFESLVSIDVGNPDFCSFRLTDDVVVDVSVFAGNLRLKCNGRHQERCQEKNNLFHNIFT